MAEIFNVVTKGEKELLRMFRTLPAKVQRRVIRPELKRAMETIRLEILLNLSGRLVRVRTGRLLAAFATQKVKTRIDLARSRVEATMELPERSTMGIASDSDWYYPAHVEYGVKRGSRRWEGKKYIREGVNAKASQVVDRIALGFANGVLREAKVTVAK